MMCGRYRRKSDKQKISEALRLTAGLDDVDLDLDDDIAPGSIQPVVFLDE
jgi:putative SOS response-associated peptidase YedK